MDTTKESFDKIFHDHYPKLFTIIYHLTANWSLAEDLTQETLIKAYQKIDTFRNESSLQVWLNRIGYNLFLDYKKKRSCELIPPDLIDSKAQTFRVEIDIAQGIEQKTMSECVQRKILSLPEIYSTPLLLDLQGYSDQEIAAILNCTLQNAKIRLHRGRKKIEEVLSNDCSLYYDERNILCCVHKD